jgi:hypothetical protein
MKNYFFIYLNLSVSGINVLEPHHTILVLPHNQNLRLQVVHPSEDQTLLDAYRRLIAIWFEERKSAGILQSSLR